jgi:hypothetical protein
MRTTLPVLLNQLPVFTMFHDYLAKEKCASGAMLFANDANFVCRLL